MASRLQRLDERYGSHHRDRQEFVFGADERAGLIADLVGGPGLDVLDIGCRTGALTQHYASQNAIVGVDVDHAALERAAARLEIETAWADVEDELPFADKSFDVVVAGEVLEHLADPALAVEHVQRVLKPGGRFVGSVPNAFRLKSRLRVLAGRHPETDPTHLQLFSPEALRSLLSPFQNVKIGFAVGRYLRLNPRLMARVQVFSAQNPR
jgi:2-polyprenyl-3-methyl-5-hydroxy-6-metoxy-1,4-benzoquinol methylase